MTERSDDEFERLMREIDSEKPPARGLARLDERIPVGEHMTVAPFRYKSLVPRHLDDGTIIPRWALLGKIYFDEVPQLDSDTQLTSYIKDLIAAARNSLRELAIRCEQNDPHFKGMDVFYGISHFANSPIAQRLGFEVHEVQNPVARWLTKIQGKSIIRRTSEQNAEWAARYNDSSRIPKEAFMPRERLIQLYGSRSRQLAAVR